MPAYECQCQGCRHQFTLILGITEHDKLKVECPKCKARSSSDYTFYAKTAKKSLSLRTPNCFGCRWVVSGPLSP
jgi:putative FmdB family regulatory protein